MTSATAWGFRPGIPKVTWTTSHFEMTVDGDKSDLLPSMAALLEECYGKQKGFFAYEPEKSIKVIFLDEEDYANGFAYSAQGWMVILLHPADFKFRGLTRWLPNVISHELGHIFTLRKMGVKSRFFGFRLFHEWKGSSASRLEESYTYSHQDVPPWLAEGLAQYAATLCGYDTLDSRRRMVMRTAAKTKTLLPYVEMEAFAWDAMRNEMIYTQGFFIISYLYKTRGKDAVNRFLSQASSDWRGAFRSAFGATPPGIYDEWRAALDMETAEDRPFPDTVSELHRVPAGLPYVDESSPTPMADGRYLFLSSRDNDFGTTGLWFSKGPGRLSRVYEKATSVSASREGWSALFASDRYHLPAGGTRSDLYEFKLGTEEIRRLTWGARIIRGVYGSDGDIFGLRNDRGKTMVVKIEGGKWEPVFQPPDSLELVDMAPGRNAGTLTLVATSGFGGDILELDLAAKTVTPLLATASDERDPAWKGDTLVFSADYGGIQEIHMLHSDSLYPITRSGGGAFRPAMAAGELWFSSFGPRGFVLRKSRFSPGDTGTEMVRDSAIAWGLPAPSKYEAGRFDRAGNELLGYSLTLGLFRFPGFSNRGGDTTSGIFEYQEGTAGFTGINLYWENPTGVLGANANLGYSVPLSYEGNAHLDRTRIELQFRAFLPTYFLGATWYAWDFPEVAPPEPYLERTATMQWYAGMELRISEHWLVNSWVLARTYYWYAGEDDLRLGRSGPHPGSYAELVYSNLNQGEENVTHGKRLAAGWSLPPSRHAGIHEWYLNGALHQSLYRTLFGRLFIEHTHVGEDPFRAWTYGGAKAEVRVPVKVTLGGRNGLGMYIDALFPGVEYLGMARWKGSRNGQPSASQGLRNLRPQPVQSSGFAPRFEPFQSMLTRTTSHEVEFSVEAKTLAFFSRPEFWTLGLRFDARDFRREPVWRLFLSL